MAIFLAASSMYLGGRFAPTYVEPVPKEWASLLVGVLVLSGSLVFFSVVAATWAVVTRAWAAAAEGLQSSTLPEAQARILYGMGKHPDEIFDLRVLNGTKARLEVEALMRELSRKGLVEFNPYDSSLVSITEKGKERAITLRMEGSQ